MFIYTQDNRNLQIEVDGKTDKDSYGNNQILLSRIMKGSYQQLAKPFHIKLKLVSPAVNSPLTLKDMLGHNVTVKLKQEDDSWRLFNGILSDFNFKGYYSYTEEKGIKVFNKELYEYGAVLSPKMILMKNSLKSRVFHEKKPTDVIKQILSEWNIDYVDSLTNSTDDTKAYYDIEQIVQYEESDLSFISRLMEKDGIYYNFWQGEDGDNHPVHKLILRDSNPVADTNLKYDYAGDTEAIREFTLGERVVPDAVRIDDYDHRQADVTFFNYDDTSINQDTDLGSYADKMQISKFDAGFVCTKDKSNAAKYRKKLKKLEAQRLRCAGYDWDGITHNRGLAAGTAFKMTGFPSGNVEGLITRVEFTARTKPFSTLNSSIDTDFASGFTAKFYAQDLGQVFRPRLETQEPKISATLNARVITVENVPTTSGEETAFQFNSDLGGNPTWLDSSTYRVKILMNWRNTQSDNTPDFTTMWLNARFGQLWADHTSGSFDIPRKGQEVLVTFVNGNLSQPVVVGSLYNSVVTPPIDSTISEGIYGSLMRSSAIKTNSDDGSYENSTSSLGNTMPLPVAAYDLGKKKNQKGFSEISMYSVDNAQFSEPSYDDASFMSSWFFPAGAPSIETLVGYKDSLGSGSAGKNMFFEGINMYSNKDVLNQAAQSQIINAGADVQISAANSITLQVGRSKITITDAGVALANTFGDQNKYNGYIAAYQDVDDNAPSEPSWALSSFSTSMALVPGVAALTAPLTTLCGTYLAEVKTWFGAEHGGLIGNSSTTGLATNVKGGFDFWSCLVNVTKLIKEVIKEVGTNAGTDAGAYAGGSTDASVNLFVQTLLIQAVLTTVAGTVTALKALTALTASEVDLKFNKLSTNGVEVAQGGVKVSKFSNPWAGYVALVRSLLPAGAGDAAASTMSLASLNQESDSPLNNAVIVPQSSDIDANSSTMSLASVDGNVSDSNVRASGNDAGLLESGNVVNDNVNLVVANYAKLSANNKIAANNDILGLISTMSGVDQDTVAAGLTTATIDVES
ncbi:MAG: type VI secretion system tip protein VgrG [Lentisphaerae bacterium]|nr:type VI secretion system tip protein VgrG [Lentisphaerota bacterium]MCP4101016.1 type VI secretion system tip protein VgrG [Lentisphaerota bacterium]